MLPYKNTCSLALSAALAPPSSEEDCSPQGASFLLAPWTITLLFPYHSTGNPLWLPSYISECPNDLKLSSFSQQFPDYCKMSQSYLFCQTPGNCQPADSREVCVLQIQMLDNSPYPTCYPLCGLHNSKTTSTGNTQLSRQYTKTGMKTLHQSSSFWHF